MAIIYVPVETSEKKLTSFMTKLKRLVDTRDNRGKRHELAFVLGSVVLAIMSGRSYGSSIQRFIKNRIKWLRRVLGNLEANPVSRAQLPRILAKVDWVALNEIIWVHFGFKIEVEQNKWYALDGKALRGIEQPGERVLLAVSHLERKTVAQKRMQGPKESEITAVRNMLAETGLEKGKITLDALHFNPTTTQQSHQAGGLFIIQLKDNQPTLFEQMSQEAAEALPVGTLKSTHKGHGRLEVRQAALFDISHLQLDPRWDQSGLATLIVMSRRTTQLVKQKSAAEVSFYLSNAQVQPGHKSLQTELFAAIRQHWHIESDNYIRDVSFQEDHVKTRDSNQGHVLASLRTLAIRVFREANIQNFRAALDDFADDPGYFEAFLRQFGFL